MRATLEDETVSSASAEEFGSSLLTEDSGSLPLLSDDWLLLSLPQAQNAHRLAMTRLYFSRVFAMFMEFSVLKLVCN